MMMMDSRYARDVVPGTERSAALHDVPLPPERVDDAVQRFLATHRALFGATAPPLDDTFLPTTMPAHPFQNADSAASLQRQTGIHMQVGTLLAGFAFAATASEGTASAASDSHLDHAIFITLCAATLVLLAAVVHFMHVDMALGTRAGARYFMAYSGKVTLSCLTLHAGTYLLSAVLPLMAYRRFPGAPPPPRTKWTRRVPHPILSGHASSLTPY
jgi:hypothetical protein